MDSGYLTNPLVFLIQVIFSFFTVIVLLRFLFQWFRVDFNNPMSQFIVTLTSPVLRPLRKYIPGYASMDIASLLLAWAVKSVEFLLILLLSGSGFILQAFLWAIPALVSTFITIFIVTIIIEAIMSWFPQVANHPAAWVIRKLNIPILGFTRRILPPISGIDLSPMIAILGLVVLKMLLIPPLMAIFQVPSGLF